MIMVRYISISNDRGRTHYQRRIWPNLEVFPGVTGCGPDPQDYRRNCIPKAYHNVSQWAVSEGLGRETIVMQDDVWIPNGPGFDAWYHGYDEVSLLIFGRTERPRQVAPKAFSATPEIWGRLAEVWDGEAWVISAWWPIVEEYGLVLDVSRG